MQFAKILLYKFIDLCEIPAMYQGIALDSLTIDIDPIPIYDGGNAIRVIINCAHAPLVRDISSHEEIFMDIMKILKLSSIRINFRGQYFLEFMNPSFSAQTIDKSKIMNNIDIGIDLNSLYASSNPVYMTDMKTETLLFANPVACSDNQKPADEFLGENIASLSYPDELEKMKRFLRLDGKLTNYEYKAMNYYYDGDLWRRKEMNFVVDIQKLEFLGCECRLSIELMGEETQQFVD